MSALHHEAYQQTRAVLTSDAPDPIVDHAVDLIDAILQETARPAGPQPARLMAYLYTLWASPWSVVRHAGTRLAVALHHETA